MMLQTTTNAPILCGVAANDERLLGFEPAPLTQSGLVQPLGPAALPEQAPKSRAPQQPTPRRDNVNALAHS
jgi:hypothetical protein